MDSLASIIFHFSADKEYKQDSLEKIHLKGANLKIRHKGNCRFI